MFSYSLSIACIKFSIEKAFCQEILLELALSSPQIIPWKTIRISILRK